MKINEMMKELGINWLTGEADSTMSGRMLCDISTEMLEELRVFLGVTTITAPEGWNNSKAVAVMLTRGVMNDFVTWAARRKGWWAVIIHKDSGVETEYTDEEYARKYRESDIRCCTLPPIGEQTRNRHEMSGRVE
jgi:hypothetical protein